jgi:hypothetical protein
LHMKDMAKAEAMAKEMALLAEAGTSLHAFPATWITGWSSKALLQ